MSASTPIDPLDLRNALGQFATGVTVITVQKEDRIHGMTANSVTSVSLEPPLVLFCVAKSARMAALVFEASGFAINILGAHQQDVSRQFAGSKKDDQRTALHLRPGTVAPLIVDALVALSCRVEAIHEGGDHWIVVGRVVAIEHGEPREPLVFFRSRYYDLMPTAVIERGAPGEMWTNDAIRIYHDEWSVGVDAAADDDKHDPPW